MSDVTKDVNVGRLRTTTSGKPSILWLRVAARSDLWPRNLASVIPFCGGGLVTPGDIERNQLKNVGR